MYLLNKWGPAGARSVLGLLFLVFGLNYFVPFLPAPPAPPEWPLPRPSPPVPPNGRLVALD